MAAGSPEREGRPAEVTRRGLIRRAFLILGIDLVGLIGCVGRRVADQPVPPARADTVFELSRAELDELVAFGEALIEGRTFGPAERRSLVEHIEDRTKRDPTRVSLYQATVSTLNRLAGRSFASLNIHERIELISRRGLAGSPVLQGDDIGPLPGEIHTVRILVVPDLIRGYYVSAAGWAVVGYETFPGRCGDLSRYTRAEP